jgi:nucleolar protein 9
MTDILTNEIGTYVLQKALLLCKDKQFSKVWKRYFRGKLEGLALHPAGSMMVQHLLDACRTQEQLQEMCSELCPMMEAILDANRHNVMSSLAAACARLEICQDEYMKAIETAFHISSKDRVMLVPLLTSLLHQELFWLCHEYKGDRTGEYTKSLNGKRVKGKLEIQLHGALILQHMAGFQRTKKLMKSLLGLDQKMLKEIACHGYGHDFFAACYSSATVTLKLKQRLTAHMQGKFCALACDLLGSRVLEAMWGAASAKQRSTIVKELCQQEGALKTNFHGFNIHRKFHMVEFTKHRGKWMQNQEKEAPHDAIRETAEDDEPKKKKPKQESEQEDSEAADEDENDS